MEPFPMPRLKPLVTISAALALALGHVGESPGVEPVAHPARPAAGGGALPTLPAYPHNAVRRQEMGGGSKSYWLFEPADPAPEVAPVVVFHHGWLAMNPGLYG